MKCVCYVYMVCKYVVERGEYVLSVLNMECFQ